MELRVMVSVKTLSAAYGIKERTIREWVARRQIPYHKLGKLVRFDLSEIKTWTETRKVSAVA